MNGRVVGKMVRGGAVAEQSASAPARPTPVAGDTTVKTRSVREQDRRQPRRLDGVPPPEPPPQTDGVRPEYQYYLPRKPRGMALFLLVAYVLAGAVSQTVPVWHETPEKTIRQPAKQKTMRMLGFGRPNAQLVQLTTAYRLPAMQADQIERDQN